MLNGGGKVDRDSLDALYNACDEADAESQARVRFVLAKDLQKRLDRYLVDRVPFLSRTSLQKLIGEDGVTVNGRRAKASTKLRQGDVVEATLPPTAEQLDSAGGHSDRCHLTRTTR